MNREDARQLIEKYQQGHCTPAEKAIVEAWLVAMEARHGRDEPVPMRRGRPVFRNWVYAAAAVLIVGIGVMFLWPDTDVTPKMLRAENIMPAGNGAVLTLADGRTVSLDSARNGIAMVATGVAYGDGTDLSIAGDEQEREPSGVYVLATPSGATYRVTLADSTEVWLNAGSKLTYPARFGTGQRVVQVEGEAFFDVKPQKLNKGGFAPFVVQSGGQSITVLGTSFNVKGYAGETAPTTTLVTGRVQVAGANGAAKVILQPGEEAVYKHGSLTKRPANLYAATAWKAGRFNFEGMDLKEVMDELARWYDLKVVYEGNIPDLEFFGGTYRNNNLATVLKILESSGIGYRLEPGPTLVITSSNVENQK